MLSFKDFKDYQIIEKFLDELSDEELEEFDLYGIEEDINEIEQPGLPRNPNSKIMKVRRQDQLQRKREYRKNRQTIKRQQAKYRKTSQFKRYKMKRDRMAKIGRTTRGTKIRTKRIIG